MKIKTILCALCAATVLGSCSYDDGGLWDAVNKQEERISALEKWQKTVVEQLNSLQGIVTASDYVTSVEKIDKDGKQGYKFSFLHAAPITLYYNENSEVSGSSSIGVAQDENGYYWTMNGEPLLVEGKPVPVTGGGGASLTPNKENPERYDLTIGETTITVDPNVVGAHPIKEVTEENGKVIVTLNDNTTKELVKWVDFEQYLLPEYTHNTVGKKVHTISLPEGFIMRLVDEVPADWAITVAGTGAGTTLTVTYPASGEARVAFIFSDGKSLSIVKELTFKAGASVSDTWVSVTYNGSAAITIPDGAINVKVTAAAQTANPNFLNHICTPLKNSTTVKNIDLSEIEHSQAIPANAFFMNGAPSVPEDPSNFNTVIETIILPKTFIKFFDRVFKNCSALKSITIPKEAVPDLGKDCFVGCDMLEKIYVPANLVDTYKTNSTWDSVKDKIIAIPVDAGN